MAQTFFFLDADTCQPLCLLLSSPAQTAAAATLPLLEMAADILNPPRPPLVLADCEHFTAYQAMGWRRAGTQNLHIRYGRMSLALIAQAATCQLRQHLDETTAAWDAKHLADNLLAGMEGDVRVCDETIVVTYYNAPQADRLRGHYQRMPARRDPRCCPTHNGRTAGTGTFFPIPMSIGIGTSEPVPSPRQSRQPARGPTQNQFSYQSVSVE